MTAGGGNTSLFGTLTSLDPIPATVTFIIVVFFVQVFDYILTSLTELTIDTPFDGMVRSIQKELTIVGCTAFLFKILITEFLILPGNWVHSLEYSDLLVPIFSLSYCSIGIGLIMMSIKQCSIWRRAHHLHIFELLDSQFQSGKGVKMPTIWDIVFNKSEIEFRIFRDIFYEMYKIQKKALAFDVYTENMFERFVSFIIEIRPFDRFLLCCILLINMGRMELGLYTPDCGDGDLTDPVYIQCKDNSLIILFTILGSVLFVVTCLVAVISRRIEIGILYRNGISSYTQYAYFLQNMEGNLVDGEDASAVEIRRLSKDDLKFAAIEGLQAAKRKKLSGPYNLAHRLFPSKFSGDVADLNIFDKLTTRISYNFNTVASGATPHPTQYGANLRAYLPILGEFEEKNGDEDGVLVENYIPETVKVEPPVVVEAKSDTHDSQKTSVRSFEEEDDNSSVSGKTKPASTAETIVQTIPGTKLQQTKSVEPDTPGNVQTSNARSRKNFWTEKTDQPYISTKNHSPMSRGTAVHPLVQKSSTLNSTSKSLSPESSSHTNSGNWTNPPLSPEDNGSDRVAPHLLSYKQHLNATKNVTKSSSHLESCEEYARKLQSHSQLASLFPLSSPDFFFEVVHCLIMLISFYIALYLTSFVASTAHAKWKAISLLPGVCGIAVFICLVRSAALIHAIYRVNFDAILEVQEQAESTDQMQILVRQTILMKLMVMAGINLNLSLASTSRTRNPSFSLGSNGDIETKLQAQLQSLFTKIDTSGDGNLSQAEFVSFMKALNISISKKKWIQILHQICRNGCDEITMDDFSLFLFPNHPKSVDLEKTRLKLLSERVERASTALQHAALNPAPRKSRVFQVLDSIQQSMK